LIIKIKINQLILIYIFLIGLYIRHGFDIGNFFLPYPICLISGSLLLLLNIYQINKTELFFICLFIFSVIYISLLSLQTGYLNERIKGSIQLCFVLGSTYGFFLAMYNKKKEYFKKISKYVLIIITILCIFELLPFTSTIIDYIHNTLFDYNWEKRLYRDGIIGLGYKRPTGLSQEASHVAWFIVIFSFIWYFTTNNNKKNLIYLIYSFFMTILIRSPIVIFSFIIFIFYIIQKKGLTNVKTLFAINFSIIMLLLIGNYILIERFSNIISGVDHSAFTRMFRPFYFIYLSFINNPFFGSGLLNNEYLINLYYQYTNDLTFLLRRKATSMFVINNIGAHFAYFGILGSSIIGYILYKIFKTIMIKNNLIFYIILLLIGMTEGSYAGQRMWAFIFLLLATFRSVHIYNYQQSKVK
tara:strand:- start:318 stop:1556 length:1239 start_codon:yes stop_codon:yes gene_type:complete